MLSSTVQIKQSQTDRKPIPYEPIKYFNFLLVFSSFGQWSIFLRLDLPPSRVTKVTVARLHFSETTMNNQRKNNRPNPDQKYLYLVVALNAVVSPSERYTVVAFNSDKVIVRVSGRVALNNNTLALIKFDFYYLSGIQSWTVRYW